MEARLSPSSTWSFRLPRAALIHTARSRFCATVSEAIRHWIFAYKSGVGLDYFENYRTVPPGFGPRRRVLAWS